MRGGGSNDSCEGETQSQGSQAELTTASDEAKAGEVFVKEALEKSL